MKFRFIYFFFLASVTLLCIYGNASGPGQVQSTDRTGSPLSPGSCNDTGCHSGGSFGTSVDIKVLSGETEITAYQPGELYQLVIEINTTSDPAEYGFQAVALSGDDNVNAGSFGTAPSGSQIISINNRDYFEHASPRASAVATIEWTAPATGTGDVSFFAAGNAVDGNNTNSGDQSAAATLVLPEESPSGTADRLVDLSVDIFPNPASELLRINLNGERSMELQLYLINMLGQTVRHSEIGLRSGVVTSQELDISDLPRGNYFLQVRDQDKTMARKIVKL